LPNTKQYLAVNRPEAWPGADAWPSPAGVGRLACPIWKVEYHDA